MTPEQATELFIKFVEEDTELDVELVDRAAILAHFTEIFAR